VLTDKIKQIITARCFGHFLRPSSGVQKTVVATTGACHAVNYKATYNTQHLFIRSFIIYSMACTSGCYYSFLYSWWWAQKASETCRLILQWLINNSAKVTSSWFFIKYSYICFCSWRFQISVFEKFFCFLRKRIKGTELLNSKKGRNKIQSPFTVLEVRHSLCLCHDSL
jgi:hypothetical protein